MAVWLAIRSQEITPTERWLRRHLVQYDFFYEAGMHLAHLLGSELLPLPDEPAGAGTSSPNSVTVSLLAWSLLAGDALSQGGRRGCNAATMPGRCRSEQRSQHVAVSSCPLPRYLTAQAKPQG